MSRDIYVFAEQRDGNIQKVALELIGKGRELADTLNQNVIAVLLGNEIKEKAESLIKAGADGVIVVEDAMLAEYTTEPYAKAVAAVIREKDPEIFLFGATAIGLSLIHISGCVQPYFESYGRKKAGSDYPCRLKDLCRSASGGLQGK